MPLPTLSVVPAGLVDHIRGVRSQLLPDTCIVTSTPESGGTFDTGTGTYTPPAAATVYTGGCRVSPRRAEGTDVDVVDDQTIRGLVVVELPHTAVGVAKDHVLTVTAGSDPDLVGRPLRVRKVETTSYLTGRVLFCEDEQ